jgi:hypothetical protein
VSLFDHKTQMLADIITYEISEKKDVYMCIKDNQSMDTESLEHCDVLIFYDNQYVKSIQIPDSVKKLYCINCPNLEFISDTPNICYVNISNCPKISQLP